MTCVIDTVNCHHTRVVSVLACCMLRDLNLLSLCPAAVDTVMAKILTATGDPGVFPWIRWYVEHTYQKHANDDKNMILELFHWAQSEDVQQRVVSIWARQQEAANETRTMNHDMFLEEQLARNRALNQFRRKRSRNWRRRRAAKDRQERNS